MGFYEPQLRTFSARPGSVGTRKRFCLTSTCYALLTLMLGNTEGVYDSLVSFEDDVKGHEWDRIPIRQVTKALLSSSWRDDDLFQVPLLLYTILKVDNDRSIIRSAVAENQEVAGTVQNLISAVLKARPHRRAGIRQENSDYIIYQVCKVIALLQDSTTSAKEVGGLPVSTLPEDVNSEIFWALLRCAEGTSKIWHGKKKHVTPVGYLQFSACIQ